MAQQTRSTIKTYFETGDVPTQSQFSDSFDSQVFWQDDVEHTLTNDATKVPASDAVTAAIAAVPTPTLEQVTTEGHTTTTPIVVEDTGVDDLTIDSNSLNYQNGGFSTSLVFNPPTGLGGQIFIEDTNGANETLAFVSQIPSTTTLVPYTGATADVDLDTHIMNAASFHAKGTAGAGHIAMKHQSAGATAAASESVIYADASGNPQWKNDSSAVQKVLIQSDITQTITNGVTDKAPSEDAIFDALALKVALSQAAYTMLANNTNGTANMAAQTFKAIAKQTYSGTITWTGTTAPSGTTSHSYSWQQVGNVVTFSLTLFYGTAGSALSQVVCALPSDMPAPVKPDGITGTSEIITMLVGQMSGGSTLSTLQGRAALRIDSSSTSAYQLVLAQSASGYKVAWISGSYLTA